MKSSEFHRQIARSKRKKWRYVAAEGSHYIYEDDNGRRYSVPYHGSKEIPEPLRRKIIKDMEI
ncbi:MAG: type II toxin-antitoxin system HicA family toxin [Tannerella sp.]|jgi:mRNA interferase HicA|nr:type II toxin-antitoxin system HicA family toxin [Tannerella sp.]